MGVRMGMRAENKPRDGHVLRQPVHMPEHSFFYERVVPALLVALGLIAAGLVLFAAGVLLGIVKF
jgi:hypothetical protein